MGEPHTPPRSPATAGRRDAQGMYFLELEVEGFRCFSDAQTLRMSRKGRPARWTILLGDNGTGKTTLLQALAHIKPTPPRTVERDGQRFLHLPAPWTSGHRFPSAPVTAPTRIGGIALSIGFGRGVARRCTSTAQVKVEWTVQPDGRITAPGPGVSLSDSGLVSRLVIGYGAYRRLRSSAAFSDADGADTMVAGLFDPEYPLIPAEDWFLQRAFAVSQLGAGTVEHQRAKRALDRVSRLLLSILPEVSALEVVIPDPTSGGAQLHAQTSYGRVRVSELGLGYQATLAWVTDLAARMSTAYPESDDPLGEPAVVLVDEIDLHLHPRWQRQLLESLTARFPNVQWVVSAHSPLIVQNAPDDTQVAVLRREGDHVVIDNDPTRVRNWRLDQILTSDLVGLPSARPAALDALVARREELLGKARLTRAEQADLTDLSERIGELPLGETASDQEALAILRRAANELKQSPR